MKGIEFRIHCILVVNLQEVVGGYHLVKQYLVSLEETGWMRSLDQVRRR